MRALWRGYVILGRLGIPVRLYSATQSVRPKFVQLHEKDSSPIERILKCRNEDREIAYNEIIKAIEYDAGHFVALSESELDQMAPQSVKRIDVKQFCADDAIKPVHFEKPYYVTPTKGGERAYTLLREALLATKRMAITQFVIHNNEHVAAIGVQEDLLMLYQLRYASELIPRSEIDAPALPKPRPDEIDVLRTVIERYSAPLFMRDYHDEYSEHLRLLVERKAKGLPMPRPEKPDAQATPEEDIINALKDTLHGPEPLQLR
jgi:DNA end-binding protein Ku